MINEIHHGDCLDVMRSLPDGIVDMVLADLPYGLTRNKWDSSIDLPEMWREFLRVGRKGCVVALTASQPFTSVLVTSNLRMFRHEWVWIKNRGSNFANTVREPMKEHESVLIFSEGGWTYNKQMQERTGTGGDRVKHQFNFRTETTNHGAYAGIEGAVLPDLRVPSSWQKFNTEVGLHPTQKPVLLFRYLMETYTNAGDLVLDPCIGSGTTAVAAVRCGRNFIGIEKDAEYTAVARRRLEQEGMNCAAAG